MTGRSEQSARRKGVGEVAGAPLRAGLIGCGRLGSGFYVPAIARAGRLELVAIAEPDLGRRLGALEAARRAGGPKPRTFGSGRSLLSAAGVDVAILAGPSGGHLELAAAAAAEGIRSLVEKPPGRDAAEAAELATLDPAPWVGFNRRFGLAAPLLDAMPAEGGEISLELSYLRRRWRPHVTRTDALDDLGSHLLDLALRIGGDDGARVRAVRLEPDSAIVELRTDRVRTRLSCATNRPWREAISIAGPDGGPLGSARLGGIAAGIRGRFARGPDPLTASLTRQLDAVAAAIAGEDAGPLARAADGERAMRAIAAVRRSHLTGGWEPLEVASSHADGRRGALAA